MINPWTVVRHKYAGISSSFYEDIKTAVAQIQTQQLVFQLREMQRMFTQSRNIN